MKENNPWQIKNKKVMYNNPWIELTHFEVLNPSGNPGIYGKLHFKNLALGILPLDDQMNTWIVGQFRFPLNQYSWEIPEGGGKIGIDPLVSAQRELKEETGIVAKKWTELLRVHTSNSVSDELGIIYLAKDLKFFEAEPDEDEELYIRKIPFNELVDMVMKGEITDSLSVAAVLKAKLLLDSGKL
ncbi:MAG: NUDIX hydrolase [Crocinitomicaceae bacterium]|nr:NUDIX hydrolase [Crocinitomicaceae bacterium]